MDNTQARRLARLVAIGVAFIQCGVAGSLFALDIVTAGNNSSTSGTVKSGTGLVSLDTGTTVFPNGVASASASANDTTGVLRVAADFEQSGVSATPLSGAVGISNIIAAGTFAGPGSGAVPVTVVFDFDAYFSEFSSNVNATYVVGLTAGIPGLKKSAGADFSLMPSLPFKSFVTGDIQTTLPTGEIVTTNNPSPGTITSASLANTPGSLAGELTVTLMVTPGQAFGVGAEMSAIVAPEVIPTSTTTGVYSNAAGVAGINGTNTGTIHVILPAGYSLANVDSPFLAGAVPEPREYLLLLLGCGVLVTCFGRNGLRRQLAS